jgi:hypothetical protein
VYGFALLYFVLSGEKNEFIFLPLKPTLPKEEEISDDEEDGGGIIIGSKKGRKEERDSKLRASWISTGSDTDGHGSRQNSNIQNPLNGYHIPVQGSNFPTVNMHSVEIDNTAAEIASLNRQLDNLMTKQNSARKSSV